MSFWRYTRPLAVLGALAVLAVGAGVAIYSEDAYSRQKTSEVVMQARILAALVPAALAFDDQEAADEYLAALRSNPHILSAALYDESDRYFAGFTRNNLSPPSRYDAASLGSSDEHIIVSVPVAQDGRQLGTVLLRSVKEPLASRVARYGGLMLLFAMLALLFGVLGAANRELAGANAQLDARATELAEVNAQLKAQIEEREKAEAALRQAQKMETIGQLTGGIAHDFNNLLTIVLGNLERLQRSFSQHAGLAKKEEVEAVVANAMQGAKRAAALTRSLLAFARRQPLAPRRVEPNRLVSGISDLLRRTLGEQIAIETVAGAGVWSTLVDPNQLESAILNLAVNARDAMPKGGRLTIETSNAYVDQAYIDRNEDIEIDPGQYVAIAVSDTGAGMTKEIIAQAFDPFFTTKGAGHGTGLGLSQVYGFVKQSGGHIKIYSEPGAGTTVRIYLPRLVADDSREHQEPQTEKTPASGSGAVVLVVEDEENVREHTVTLVEELGYAALSAANGEEALKIIEDRPDIDILFTDVGLPGAVNGRQLADAAVRLRPSLKVLYTTGYARNAIVHDGRLDPGVQLVTKPFSYAEVGFALRRVLAPAEVARPILLVEDEVLIRAHTAIELADLGFAVTEAGTGAQAIERLKSSQIPCFAAIVDLGLPDIRGDDLAEQMRKLSPQLLIIIASGRSDPEVRRRFSGDSLVQFLDKPYDLKRLKEALLDR